MIHFELCYNFYDNIGFLIYIFFYYNADFRVLIYIIIYNYKYNYKNNQNKILQIVFLETNKNINFFVFN